MDGYSRGKEKLAAPASIIRDKMLAQITVRKVTITLLTCSQQEKARLFLMARRL